MKAKNVLKIILITIVVLIALSISTVSNAAIKSNQYKLTRKEGITYILGIYQNTRVDSFKQNIITTDEIEVFNKNGEKVKETEIIQTGNKIKIGQTECIAIVCGDTNGDGKAGVTDLLDIKKHLIGKEKLENEKAVAADVDVSQKVSNTDILNLKRLIVRIIEERQIYESEGTNEEYIYKKNKLTDKVTIVKLANNKKTGVLQIPNKIDGLDVTKIEDFLGENNRITKVIIPTNVESISNIAFSGMRDLEEIHVSKLNEQYSSDEGILYNKEGTKLEIYPRGKEDKEYIITENIKEIGEYAFYKNDKIETIYIPESIANIAKTAFEEMAGKVYIKENSKVKSILDKEEIKYTVDKAPKATKLTYSIGTNQVVTVNIEASDAEGITAWSIGKKGNTQESWKQISSTKSLKTTYTEITQNGTYVLKIKDKAGNIGTKEVTITELDESKPQVISMKIISPTNGEYKQGQKVIIRVEFNEKIKGTAPTLKLRIGDAIGTGNMTTSSITGNTKYIDYTYITTNQQFGKIEIYSYSGGNLTDSKGNPIVIRKLSNVGNIVNIIPKLEVLTGTTRIPTGNMQKAELDKINKHLRDYVDNAELLAKASGRFNPKRARVMAAAYWLIYNPFYRVQYQWGRPLQHDGYDGIGWDPAWSEVRGIECQNFVVWSLWNAGAKSVYPNWSVLQHSKIYLTTASDFFTVREVLDAGIEPGDVLRRSRMDDTNGHWAIVMKVNYEEGYLEVAHAVSPGEDTLITRYNIGDRFRYQFLYKLPDFYSD